VYTELRVSKQLCAASEASVAGRLPTRGNDTSGGKEMLFIEMC